MGHGITCYSSDGKATLDTESGSLQIIHEQYECAFDSAHLSYTFTIPGFDHTKKGHVAMIASASSYIALFKIEYPAIGQVKVSGGSGYSCRLLVLIA